MASEHRREDQGDRDRINFKKQMGRALSFIKRRVQISLWELESSIEITSELEPNERRQSIVKIILLSLSVQMLIK